MEEALIKRVLPHSLEAEQSVVGAMLMDKDAIMTAAEIVSREDLSRRHMAFCLRLWWNFSMKGSRSI